MSRVRIRPKFSGSGHRRLTLGRTARNNVGRWAPCDWRVRDVNSRVVVGSGTVGVNRKALSIFGLYGYYQLELRGCMVSATGSLSND